MSVIYILLPVAVLLAVVGVVAFVWSVRSGQLDDLDTPAVRVLHDDAEEPGSAAAEGGDPGRKRS